MLQIGVHMLHAFKYMFSRDNSVPMSLERIGLTEKYYMAHNMKKHAVIYKFGCLLNTGSDSKHTYIIF